MYTRRPYSSGMVKLGFFSVLISTNSIEPVTVMGSRNSCLDFHSSDYVAFSPSVAIPVTESVTSNS